MPDLSQELSRQDWDALVYLVDRMLSEGFSSISNVRTHDRTDLRSLRTKLEARATA